MNMQKQSKPEEHSLDFMLAEFETLRGLRSDMKSMGESRVNIFLLAVSGGLVGGLALLNKSSGFENVLPPMTGLVILVGLFLLGFITFRRTIETDINMKIYARGLNRIRRYFVQLDPDLREYLLLPISDDQPRFGTLGWLPSGGQFFSLESMVAVINSTIATVAVSAFARGILELENLQVGIDILTFLVVCGAHYRYMSNRFKKAENQAENQPGIRFPSHTTSDPTAL
jgi:hypothetical protein